MEFSSLVNGGISNLMPYRMGKTIEQIQEEVGAKNLIRLNAGESPYGVSRKVREVLKQYESYIPYYPDSAALNFKNKLFNRFNYEIPFITVGADTTELISLICRAFLRPGLNVIIPQLSSIMHERAVQLSGAEIITTAIMDDWTPDFDAIVEAINDHTRMIMLSNPSNPIGAFSVFSQIDGLLRSVPNDVLVVVDEELVDYLGLGYKDLYPLLDFYPNLMILRSFSHAYGLAGLRIGYMLSCEEISGIINVLRDPYNVSSIALDCATAALSDGTFFNFVIEKTTVERNRFREFCGAYGLETIDTHTCSITINFGNKAERYYNALVQLGVFTRPLGYLGLPTLLNITLGHPRETDFVLKHIEQFLTTDSPR